MHVAGGWVVSVCRAGLGLGETGDWGGDIKGWERVRGTNRVKAREEKGVKRQIVVCDCEIVE